MKIQIRTLNFRIDLMLKLASKTCFAATL